ncbi:MAG: hypothetical protein RLZ71_351 [Actinomycetota bacterium]|jgi:uncharacterized membrane protein YhaH (DUF805 family)
MDFAGAIKSGLLKWNKFSGTASKSEFWYFFLFMWMLGQVINVIDMAVNPAVRDSYAFSDSETLPTLEQFLNMLPWVSILVSVVTFVPNLSITYRRIQDSGRSGKLAFLQFIPLFFVVALVVTAISSLNTLSSPTSSDSEVLGIAITMLAELALGALTGLTWVVFWFIWMLAPTKTRAQGNPYAEQ